MRTEVREGASIGANATIVCGVTIGRYAFVGAGTVVIREFRLTHWSSVIPRGRSASCANAENVCRNTLACTCGQRFERDDEGLRQVALQLQ